jgi:ribosome-associated translation inhibitor RaiA
MTVQVNTDRNIQGSDRLNSYVQDLLESKLQRLSEHITRIEVHLSDENAGKSGTNDKRCMIEARLQGRQPTAVTHHADGVDLAISGAIDKLVTSLDTTLDKMRKA